VPQVDLVEETFVAAAPALVAARVRDPGFVARLWPDLHLTVFMDRGEAGVRWAVTGALAGSSEIWLEPYGDGVIVHCYLRTEATARGSATRAVVLAPRAAAAEVRRRARHAKRVLWGLKDELEAGREPGGPAASGPGAGSSGEPPRPTLLR